MPEEPQVTEQPEESLEIEALQAERDQLFDRLQRLAAEFDNFRKRTAREQAALSERAGERLVKARLPLLARPWRGVQARAAHRAGKMGGGLSLVHRPASPLAAGPAPSV